MPLRSTNGGGTELALAFRSFPAAAPARGSRTRCRCVAAQASLLGETDVARCRDDSSCPRALTPPPPPPPPPRSFVGDAADGSWRGEAAASLQVSRTEALLWRDTCAVSPAALPLCALCGDADDARSGTVGFSGEVPRLVRLRWEVASPLVVLCVCAVAAVVLCVCDVAALVWLLAQLPLTS